MADYLDWLSDKDLLLSAHDIYCDYNKAQERLKKKVEYYSRQSIASTYHKEDDIVVLAHRCKELKKQYLAIRDVLIGRGVSLDLSSSVPVRNNDLLFAHKDVLHSV